MPNKRLGDEKKETVTIRLPIWMIRQIKSLGSVQAVLEPIIAQHFEKEEENQKNPN